MTSAALTPLLEARHLHVAYGKVEAVHDLSLAVAPGTIVSVIGPNGAGKTTLLAALMGLLPARGEIAYLGAPATRLSVEQKVARGQQSHQRCQQRSLSGTVRTDHRDDRAGRDDER